MGPDEAMAHAWRANNPTPAAPNTQPAPAGSAPEPGADDYAAAWHENDSLLDRASQNWNDFKHDHPNWALVLGSTPGTNEVTSALELNDAKNHGDKLGMGLAAAGIIPGATLFKDGVKAIHAGEATQRAARAAIVANRTAPVSQAELRAGADAYSASKAAGQTLKNTGAAKAVMGAGAEGTSTASNLADYAHAWHNDAN